MNFNDRRLDAYKKILNTETTTPENGDDHEGLVKVPGSTQKDSTQKKETAGARKVGTAPFGNQAPGGASFGGASFGGASFGGAASGGFTAKPENAGKDTAYRKVAKFLLLIGTNEAAMVMSRLSPEQTERVVLEIASIRRVDKDEAALVLAEFESLLKKAREPSGGIDTARSILEAAFGTERAEAMLKKAVPDINGKPFDYLEGIDPDRLLRLIADELPVVKALVLSRMKPKQAAAVLQLMDDTMKNETILRLAKLKVINPDVLHRVDETMREKVQTVETGATDSIDGRAALAEILRRMDGASEKAILANLTGNDPDLGKDLRERLFTIDDIVHADNKFVQEQLRLLADHDVAILVSGKSEAFRAKIFGNISKTRGAMVLEDEKYVSPVPKADSVRITGNFFAAIRRAWELGEFYIDGRDTKEEWVK